MQGVTVMEIEPTAIKVEEGGLVVVLEKQMQKIKICTKNFENEILRNVKNKFEMFFPRKSPKPPKMWCDC